MDKEEKKPQVKRNVLRLPPPHSVEQQIYIDSQAPITACAWGTKAGKTFGSAEWATKYCWEHGAGETMPFWWVAPIYKQSKIAARLIKQFLPNDPGRVRYLKTEHRIEILRANGEIHVPIEFRSAEDSDSLQGEGLLGAVVDEADRMKRDSWESFLTTITRTNAPVRVISSPKRRAWFYELCRQGMALTREQKRRLHAGDKTASPYGVFYMNCPTRINPYISESTIARLKAILPERAFRCYYLAEFPDSDGIVFTNINAIFFEDLYFEEEPNPGELYICSLDLARHTDYCVLIIGSVSRRRIVNIMRWRNLGWEASWRRAISYAEAYNAADVIIDCTTYGDPILEQMQQAETPCHVEGFNFTGKSKGPLIDNLVLGIEKADMKIPLESATEWCKEELEIYEYDISEAGNVKYSAPDGKHDDFVSSLAMWYWHLTHQVTPGIRVFNSSDQIINKQKQDKSTEDLMKELQKEADKNAKALVDHERKKLLSLLGVGVGAEEDE